MSIKITKIQNGCCGGIWVKGETGDGFRFCAKVYAGPSIYGIPTPRFEDGGNVSKLQIADSEGREVLCYDRGFAGEHDEVAEDAMNEIVLSLETMYAK